MDNELWKCGECGLERTDGVQPTCGRCLTFDRRIVHMAPQNDAAHAQVAFVIAREAALHARLQARRGAAK